MALCELCEEEQATLACPTCDQELCAGCDGDLHKPAKLATHKRNPIGGKAPPPAAAKAAPVPSAEDLLCELCEDSPAEVVCPICDQELCKECDAQLHKPAKTQSHKRHPKGGAAAPAPTAAKPPPPKAAPAAAAPAAGGALCDLCEENPATIQCDDCGEVFCRECNQDMHKPAAKQSHKRKPLAATPTPAPPTPKATPPAPTPKASPPPPTPKPTPPPRVATPPPAVVEPEPEPEPEIPAGPAMCDMCSEELAVWCCVDCGNKRYCAINLCDRNIHAVPKKMAHVRVKIEGLPAEAYGPPTPAPVATPPPAAAAPVVAAAPAPVAAVAPVVTPVAAASPPPVATPSPPPVQVVLEPLVASTPPVVTISPFQFQQQAPQTPLSPSSGLITIPLGQRIPSSPFLAIPSTPTSAPSMQSPPSPSSATAAATANAHFFAAQQAASAPLQYLVDDLRQRLAYMENKHDLLVQQTTAVAAMATPRPPPINTDPNSLAHAASIVSLHAAAAEASLNGTQLSSPHHRLSVITAMEASSPRSQLPHDPSSLMVSPSHFPPHPPSSPSPFRPTPPPQQPHSASLFLSPTPPPQQQSLQQLIASTLDDILASRVEDLRMRARAPSAARADIEDKSPRKKKTRAHRRSASTGLEITTPLKLQKAQEGDPSPSKAKQQPPQREDSDDSSSGSSAPRSKTSYHSLLPSTLPQDGEPRPASPPAVPHYPASFTSIELAMSSAKPGLDASRARAERERDERERRERERERKDEAQRDRERTAQIAADTERSRVERQEERSQATRLKKEQAAREQQDHAERIRHINGGDDRSHSPHARVRRDSSSSRHHHDREQSWQDEKEYQPSDHHDRDHKRSHRERRHHEREYDYDSAHRSSDQDRHRERSRVREGKREQPRSSDRAKSRDRRGRDSASRSPSPHHRQSSRSFADESSVPIDGEYERRNRHAHRRPQQPLDDRHTGFGATKSTPPRGAYHAAAPASLTSPPSHGGVRSRADRTLAKAQQSSPSHLHPPQHPQQPQQHSRSVSHSPYDFPEHDRQPHSANYHASSGSSRQQPRYEEAGGRSRGYSHESSHPSHMPRPSSAVPRYQHSPSASAPTSAQSQFVSQQEQFDAFLATMKSAANGGHKQRKHSHSHSQHAPSEDFGPPPTLGHPNFSTHDLVTRYRREAAVKSGQYRQQHSRTPSMASTASIQSHSQPNSAVPAPYAYPYGGPSFAWAAPSHAAPAGLYSHHQAPPPPPPFDPYTLGLGSAFHPGQADPHAEAAARAYHAALYAATAARTH